MFCFLSLPFNQPINISVLPLLLPSSSYPPPLSSLRSSLFLLLSSIIIPAAFRPFKTSLSLFASPSLLVLLLLYLSIISPPSPHTDPHPPPPRGGVRPWFFRRAEGSRLVLLGSVPPAVVRQLAEETSQPRTQPELLPEPHHAPGY